MTKLKDTRLKCNDNKNDPQIILPLPPLSPTASSERDIYARFMRHLRNVPNSRVEIKILSAIQFTADMMDVTDALVAKVLVDCGLRAPRSAFPTDYLDFVDQSLFRSGWEIGGPTQGALELRDHWDRIGEDKFAFYRKERVIIEEPMFVET